MKWPFVEITMQKVRLNFQALSPHHFIARTEQLNSTALAKPGQQNIDLCGSRLILCGLWDTW